MKKSNIQLGNSYQIQLGKNTSTVKVASFDETHGTWLCETDSGKTLRVKDAKRFLKEIKPKVQKAPREIIAPKTVANGKSKAAPQTDEAPKHMGPKPLGEMSVLAAAHKVLLEEGRPMTVAEIMATALARNYCIVGGKTPFNTFNGGIRMEIAKKGKASRFVWVAKGQFAAR